MPILTDEPVLITNLAGAAIMLAIVFGVPITADQKEAIIGFVAAAYLVVTAFILRAKVTPTAKLPTAQPGQKSTRRTSH